MISASLRSSILVGIAAVVMAISLGCTRGRPTENTPIHLNPNMDHQPKYLPQSEGHFFEDGMTMRKPVAGTVARGELHEDDAYWRGRDDIDSVIAHIPVPVNMQLLERGEQRFNIYCSPCHGRTGEGRGIVVQRGMLPPPNFHDDRLRKVGDGYIFNVITNGIRNMPSYKAQIPVEDRWAIVAYFRALQRSQNATINDVPPELRGTIK